MKIDVKNFLVRNFRPIWFGHQTGITKRDGTKFVPGSLRPGTGRDDSEFDRDGTTRN